MKKKINIHYYASLREQRGLSEEFLETDSSDIGEFYEELKEEYRFSLSADQLKAAVNDEFCSWDSELKDGDKVVFIPPVSGG